MFGIAARRAERAAAAEARAEASAAAQAPAVDRRRIALAASIRYARTTFWMTLGISAILVALVAVAVLDAIGKASGVAWDFSAQVQGRFSYQPLAQYLAFAGVMVVLLLLVIVVGGVMTMRELKQHRRENAREAAALAEATETRPSAPQRDRMPRRRRNAPR